MTWKEQKNCDFPIVKREKEIQTIDKKLKTTKYNKKH